MRGISWVAEDLLASQEGFRSKALNWKESHDDAWKAPEKDETSVSSLKTPQATYLNKEADKQFMFAYDLRNVT
jgi:hypothetical protein